MEGNTLAFAGKKENIVITSESVEGALRIHSGIGDMTASSSLSRRLDLPDDASWIIHEEGIIEVRDGEVTTTFIVVPSWAKNSTGTELPTSFDSDGKALARHVDTTGVPAENYPVVSEPYMGKVLFHELNTGKQYRGDLDRTLGAVCSQ